jgi:hypothetical protein
MAAIGALTPGRRDALRGPVLEQLRGIHRTGHVEGSSPLRPRYRVKLVWGWPTNGGVVACISL